MRSAVHVPIRELHVPIRELHVHWRELNVPRRELHVPIWELHVPIWELHVPIWGLHVPSRELNVPIRELNEARRGVHVPIRELHVPNRELNDGRRRVEYPREVVRVPGIAVLLLLAVLPLARWHPRGGNGLVGLVRARLERVERERQARMTVPDEAHTFPSWYPRIERDRIDAIMGTIRVERLYGVVSVAEDRPYSSFFAATQIPDGWLFASNDGVLYRARRFTGPLVAVGTVPRELHFHPESRGRVVLGDNHGRWWTTDGTSPLQAMAMDSHPLVMAFASSERGAAVLQGGRLIATDDGGHTWRSVHTDLIAYNVSGSPDGLFVETLDGLRTLLPDGSLAFYYSAPFDVLSDLAFLRAAQHRPSLKHPSGGIDRLPEFVVGEQSFHLGTFQCHEGPVMVASGHSDNPARITINGTASALPPLTAAPVVTHDPTFQTLADGGVVMYDRVTVAADLARSPFPHGGAIPVTMLVAREVHTDGTLGDRMGVLLSRDEGAVIAARNDGWGIAVVPPDASDDILLHPFDHGPPLSLGLLLENDMSACGYVQPPDATLLWDYGGVNLQDATHLGNLDPEPPPYLLPGAREAIELSASGACLRRIEAARYVEAPPSWTMGTLRLDARPGNTLSGTVDDGTRVRNVWCSASGDILGSATAHRQ